MNFVVDAYARVTPNVLNAQLRSIQPLLTKKFHDKVLADQGLRMRETFEALDMSMGSLVSMLTDMRLPTIDKKRNLVTNFAFLKRNSNMFLRRSMSMDKTWIYHITPEAQKLSKKWAPVGESVPKSAALDYLQKKKKQ